MPTTKQKTGITKTLSAVVSSIAMVCAGTASAEPPLLHQAQPIVFQSGTLRVESPVSQAGSLYLLWSGTIAPPMRDRLEAAFESFKSSRSRVVLIINSGGGMVSEGEKVITLLQRIRRSHRLDTVVQRGGVCGSMCVPIYLQGQTRFGARTSAWLFHEITRRGSLPFVKKKVDGKYSQLIEQYWIGAGVSRAWIDRMLPLATGHDYWQTGQELIADRAGIITMPIENRVVRHLEADDSLPATGATPQAHAPSLSTPVQRPPPASTKDAPTRAPATEDLLPMDGPAKPGG